jgi:sulfite reductase (ferredoxin)
MERHKPDKPAVTLKSGDPSGMSKVERIKAESQGLFFVPHNPSGRHSFAEEVDALSEGKTDTLSNEGKELSKFFGFYKQQARGERGRKTDDYFFMVRIKNPAGGSLSSEQWATIDEAADRYGDGTLRITSRQGIQYHHIYGPKLAPLVRHLNRGYRRGATLGACGDVNRNTMTSPIDGLDPSADPQGHKLAHSIADALAPRSSSYFQVFLSDDEGRTVKPLNADEPLYGKHYLPRKFKVGLAHPQDNSVDILTQDVGLFPVRANGVAVGRVWDLYSGGGMGLTHNNPSTAALLGLYHGRLRREQVVETVKAIAILQKENGERRDRRQARWKYTIRRLGLDAVNREMRDRFGIELEEGEPEQLPPVELHLGWHDVGNGEGFFGVGIENGRIVPELRRGIRTAVEELRLSVRLTPHQDLILCHVRDRRALERILESHGLGHPERQSRVRRYAMACPAKPTCGLAMTEAERILPHYVAAIETAGLGDVDAEIRMTGCPNNCARPPTAEIGIYGYGKNEHVVLVGGSRRGTRLARVLYSRVSEQRMIPVLVGLLRAVREHNRDGLPVGDFLHQTDPAQLRRWIGIEE